MACRLARKPGALDQEEFEKAMLRLHCNERDIAVAWRDFSGEDGEVWIHDSTLGNSASVAGI